MYDPAIFLTDEEYYKTKHIKTNIQAQFESPHLYLLERCPSNDQEEDRLEDIIFLSVLYL